jgi:hypothetical protein
MHYLLRRRPSSGSPETVENICVAARSLLGVDLEPRDDADPTGGDTHWNYSGDGVTVPPGDIVAVETVALD